MDQPQSSLPSSSVLAILHAWQESAQYEHSRQSAALLPHGLHEEEFANTWSKLVHDQWLVLGASGKFGLNIEAINALDAIHPRISPKCAHQVLAKTIQRIDQWNEVAYQRGWPTIATAVVWGSLARPDPQESYGDVDVAIVWRQAQQPLTRPPILHNPALALVQQLADQPSSWEIEDVVETWLSTITHLSLSGVDQWNDIAHKSPFHATRVYADQWWAGDNPGPGLRPWEVEALQKHVSPAAWESGLPARFVLK